MIGSNFKDYFSSGSADYAAHRPTYPDRLIEQLAKISPANQLALDCGCGTGQLSVRLAERFDRVVATDASSAQIQNAQPHPRVTYHTGLAEQSGLPDASVDLITVAQAAHWLDLDKFYAEVRRVARPNAVVALITYGVMHVDDAVEQILQHFYFETIAPYWPPERRLVEDGYRSLPFPFRETQLPPIAIEVDWNCDDLLGYVSTWSAVKAAEKAVGSELVKQFTEQLREAWGDPSLKRHVTWPLAARVGHV